jgi:hypothetical protein
MFAILHVAARLAGVALAPLLLVAGAALAMLPPPTARAGPQLARDWPTFDDTPARSGFVAGDTSLTTRNVGSLRRAWIATYDDIADSTPILLAHVRMPRGGTRALLFQTTKSGTTWRASNCPPARGS